MSVLRQRTSQRTKKLWVAGGIGAAAMGVVSIGLIAWMYNSMANSRNEMEARYQQMMQEQQAMYEKQQQEKRKAYVIVHDVKPGTLISEMDLMAVDLPKDAVPEDMVLDEKYPVGKFTKYEIKRNTPLIRSMLYEEGITPNDMRFQEFRVITLPSDLKKDEYLDVRIKFPTGQDYIVLGKKKVTQLNGPTVWFAMDEKEILTMSSAIVDAYIEQATIYAVTYVDPSVQQASVVNYPVNQKVQGLIASNPNVLAEAKRGLESRVRQSLENGLREMNPSERENISRQLNEPARTNANTNSSSTPRPSSSSADGAGSTSEITRSVDEQRAILENNNNFKTVPLN